MPRQRKVKPWTIYPPTQEYRDIIERKAAEVSLSVSAYLCMVGKLACVNVNLPTVQQPAQPAQKKNSKEDDLGAIFDEIEAEKEAEDVANPTDLRPFARNLGCVLDEPEIVADKETAELNEFMDNLGLATERLPVEPEPTQKKTYKLYNLQGEPLSEAEERFVLKERAAGCTNRLFLSDDEDPYNTRQVYYCIKNDFKFEVVHTKEE